MYNTSSNHNISFVLGGGSFFSLSGSCVCNVEVQTDVLVYFLFFFQILFIHNSSKDFF